MANEVKWARRNLTLILAVLFTVLLGVFVWSGKLEASRAVIAFIICWIMASHSLDVNRHGAEVAAGFDKLAQAGIDARTGQPVRCAQDLRDAGTIGREVYAEVQAERRAESTGA